MLTAIDILAPRDFKNTHGAEGLLIRINNNSFRTKSTGYISLNTNSSWDKVAIGQTLDTFSTGRVLLKNLYKLTATAMRV